MTHYERLGVRPDAPVEEIRSAYRRAVRRLHPDANPDAGRPAVRRLSELSEAWAVLRDAERRRGYDRSLAAAAAPRPLAPPPFVDPRPVRRRVTPTAAPVASGGATATGHRRSPLPALAAALVGSAAVVGLLVVVAHGASPMGGGGDPGQTPRDVLLHPLADQVAGTVSDAEGAHLAALGNFAGPSGLRWAIDERTDQGRLPSGNVTLSRDDGVVLCTAPIDSAPAPGTVSGVCDAAPTRVTLHLDGPLTGRPVLGDIRLDPLPPTP